jgi:hypothetical protein
MPEPDALTRNADAPWSNFSAYDYWSHNYESLQSEDREIIRLVSEFLADAFRGRPLAGRAIDVGSGPNLYPALLMLPWTGELLLTDYSPDNIGWLRRHVLDEAAPWTWQPFWAELRGREGYDGITDPRKQLRAACAGQPGQAGIETRSIFELPEAQWQLGTMFFVAESITQDPLEFRAAVGAFLSALEEDAPFAAAFMAGSEGYGVGRTSFPALGVSRDDVESCMHELGARKLTVTQIEVPPGVRPGYTGMIVATGLAGGR